MDWGDLGGMGVGGNARKRGKCQADQCLIKVGESQMRVGENWNEIGNSWKEDGKKLEKSYKMLINVLIDVKR